ncbi:glycosyltransferase family 4 protein [Vagococcus vulneris]|uniref:Glycosyltransferase family 1 protein n=1 Tax=Vagococcus vulneris TaxID=1977869 RepID=A0A429ZZX2_9ENTE|nr:glycosyltransferase family 4 protein [Vagococcus vulneris]RST99569.1 hypothetical protein CBF37_04375 [Vagococcus vulneris]
MKKVLFVATVVKGHIDVFHIPFLEEFKKNGWEVHVAAKNNYDNAEECVIPFCDKFFDIPFERSPLGKNNISSYQLLKGIIQEGNYEIIHCHTPVGGALTRLVAKNLKSLSSKIIYTAHGFHFFKGAPLKNWLIFYPIEKYLSKYTDTLITINQEDYDIAKKKFYCHDVKLVPGVGVAGSKFYELSDEKKQEIFKLNNLDRDKFYLIYIAELSNRKNQMFLLEAMKKLKVIDSSIVLLLVGMGDNYELYKKFIKRERLESNVKLLGYRKDINNLINISDIVVSSSKQEGLPVNLIEGMTVGKPLVVSDVRGNRDLVINNENGFTYRLSEQKEFLNYILFLRSDKEKYRKFQCESQSLATNYNLNHIMCDMRGIYFKPRS